MPRVVLTPLRPAGLVDHTVERDVEARVAVRNAFLLTGGEGRAHAVRVDGLRRGARHELVGNGDRIRRGAVLFAHRSSVGVAVEGDGHGGVAVVRSDENTVP